MFLCRVVLGQNNRNAKDCNSIFTHCLKLFCKTSFSYGRSCAKLCKVKQNKNDFVFAEAFACS